jgi:hypothetical protein
VELADSVVARMELVLNQRVTTEQPTLVEVEAVPGLMTLELR